VDSPVVWGCASVPAKPRARSELLLRELSARELVSSVDDSGPLSQSTDGEHAAPNETTPPPVPAESSPMILDDEDEEILEPPVTIRAVALLRRLPELDGLHKGRHLRHVERDGNFLLALSFSGIYLLCIVFDGPFDELRAERAAHESLPRIE